MAKNKPATLTSHNELTPEQQAVMRDLAFPLVFTMGSNVNMAPGLSRRELFAAMALQALLGETTPAEPDRADLLKLVTSASVQIADALIAELAKEKPRG